MTTTNLTPIQACPDSEIISAILRGEKERFGDLVDRYERMLYAVAWSRLRNAGHAEDVVQETFLQAYRFLPTLRDASRLPAWLAKIARGLSGRVAKGAAREEKTAASIDPSLAVTDPRCNQGSPHHYHLENCLAGLAANHREALVLYYMEGRSVKESAAALGVSEAALKVRLHRARLALRRDIEEAMERDLQQLGPATAMRPRVMAALPVATMEGLSAPLLGLVKFAPALLPPALAMGMLALFTASVARNYRDNAAVRRRILWKNFVMLWGTVVVFVLAAHWLHMRLGPQALFWVLAAFMAWSTLGQFFLWRLARTRFAAANFAGGVAAVVSLAGVGAGVLHPTLGMVGFVVYNVCLAWARKDWPQRNDYNLLQRQAMGALGAPVAALRGDAISQDTVDGFVRLMASRMLCIWRTRLADGGVRLLLTPIALSPMRAMIGPLPIWQSLSALEISSHGHCRVSISTRDRKQLSSLFPTAVPAELERGVECAVESALAQYAAGQPDQALQILESQTDEQVFHRQPHKLMATRVLIATGVIAGFAMLALLAALHFRTTGAPNRPPHVDRSSITGAAVR